MNAQSYLESLGINLLPQAASNIGRLAINGEFILNGGRGVVIQPKRGPISKRYLNLLAAENVTWVVSDNDTTFVVYGKNIGGSLELIPALPISGPTLFPTPDIFKVFAERLRKAYGPKADLLIEGSKLFATKLADERQVKKGKFPPETLLSASGEAQKALRSAIALLEGYRLTPKNQAETAILLDGLAQLASPRSLQVGLPATLLFALHESWFSNRDVCVVSSALGCQFIPLWGAKIGSALLPGRLEEASDLFRDFFPTTSFLFTNFLAWFPKTSPDRLIIFPPHGSTDITPGLLELNKNDLDKKTARRIPLEIHYIKHALEIAAPGALLIVVAPEGLLASVGHSDFRSWLLEQVRLLAVVSLPAGSCFAGTANRFSLLYLQKISPLPSDYPIFMIDVAAEDLLTPERGLELLELLGNFLEKEMPQ